MNKILITFLVTSALFIIGISSFKKIDNYFFTPHYIRITGLVSYHKNNPVPTGDAPSGYYIRDNSLGMIYLKNKNISEASGFKINANGLLSEICNDYTCYPMIDIKSINIFRE